jgi:hypothetical protein
MEARGIMNDSTPAATLARPPEDVTRVAQVVPAVATGLLDTIHPETLYATYATGGSLSVGRFSDEVALCRLLGQAPAADLVVTRVVISIDADIVEHAPMDSVHLLCDAVDPAAELADIDRAITALQAAREALAYSQRSARRELAWHANGSVHGAHADD